MTKRNLAGRPQKSVREKLVRATFTLPPEYISWLKRRARLNGHGNVSHAMRDIVGAAYAMRHK